jgi:hypothetical protein
MVHSPKQAFYCWICRPALILCFVRTRQPDGVCLPHDLLPHAVLKASGSSFVCHVQYCAIAGVSLLAVGCEIWSELVRSLEAVPTVAMFGQQSNPPAPFAFSKFLAQHASACKAMRPQGCLSGAVEGGDYVVATRLKG